MTAKTTYEVRRPDSTWTLDPQGAPVAVTNICEPAPGFAGYWHLTTGRYGTNLGLPGMYYTYQMTDLKGYTNQWSASFVQTVWISWQGNMITEPATSWNLLCPSPSMQSTGSVAGLDTAFPYRLFGQAVSGSSHDTPRSALKTFESWVWRKDKFWSYLMWQPTRRPGSISVPLKLQSWTWQGSTGKTNDTTWPWRRTGWLNQTGGNGFDEYVHPTWETNVADSFDFRMTNNYHYPTMW